MNYIIDENKNIVQEPDLIKWANWYETHNRHIGKDYVGRAKISTVFLGIDHNLNRVGPPILWETMIFGGPLDMEQFRCAGSWEQAEAMHEEAVETVERIMQKERT